MDFIDVNMETIVQVLVLASLLLGFGRSIYKRIDTFKDDITKKADNTTVTEMFNQIRDIKQEVLEIRELEELKALLTKHSDVVPEEIKTEFDKILDKYKQLQEHSKEEE